MFDSKYEYSLEGAVIIVKRQQIAKRGGWCFYGGLLRFVSIVKQQQVCRSDVWYLHARLLLVGILNFLQVLQKHPKDSIM